MSPRRSSTRTHQPVQRRPRNERACHFCRIAKQRCEPIEYGTNDRPCRRCVSQGLECNIPGAARSQSPSSGLGVQGPGPVRHPIVPQFSSGSTEEPTVATETNVQYTPRRSGSLRAPTEGWPPLMMHPDERQGSSTTILSAEQTALQTQSFLPLAPSMGGYQQNFPDIAQGSANLESGYFPQDYYGQTTSCNTYMASYATQSASDGAPNLGYVMEEPQPDDGGAFADEKDASPSRSGES